MSETTNFVKYIIETGRVVMFGYCRSEDYPRQAEFAQPGERYTTGTARDTETVYVVNDAVQPRPQMPVRAFGAGTFVADDTSEFILSGIPNGAVVSIDGNSFTMRESELRLTSPTPATYDVKIELWPFLPYGMTVVCRAV